MSAILIYDGDCGFCTTSATWIAGKWVDATTQLTPWQFLTVSQFREYDLTPELAQQRVYWHDDSGLYGAERAIARALRAARRPWSFLGAVIDVRPIRWIARPVYWLVARYRHRLPGGTPACQMR